MRKTEAIYLGDKVRTKKSFKPFMQNEERFDPEGELYDGTVVGKRGGFLMIDFHKKLPFTHYLGNMLQEPTGCGVEYKHLVATETYKSDDKHEQEFVGLMKELKFEELSRLPREIRQKEDKIHEMVARTKGMLRDVGQNERATEKEEFVLKELKDKKVVASVDSDQIIKQYRAMKKNKRIKTIEVMNTRGETDILITTNDLTYKNERTNMPDYNLGAYKILIPLNIDRNMQIINYKKHVMKYRYHHPCITDSSTCLGNAMQNEVHKLRKNGNIINLSHILINFLEVPNYGQPHLSEELFYCSQPVTIRPRDKYDWFNKNYWEEHESWDGAKYTEDEKKIREKLKELRDANPSDDSDDTCPECGYEGSPDEDGECPNCNTRY